MWRGRRKLIFLLNHIDLIFIECKRLKLIISCALHVNTYFVEEISRAKSDRSNSLIYFIVCIFSWISFIAVSTFLSCASTKWSPLPYYWSLIKTKLPHQPPPSHTCICWAVQSFAMTFVNKNRQKDFRRCLSWLVLSCEWIFYRFRMGSFESSNCLIRFLMWLFPSFLQFSSALFSRFGAILNDTPTVQVNLIGTALNIGYVCFFFWYTNNVKEKMLAWAQIGYALAFVAAVFVYTYLENPKDLPFRYGLLTTAVLFYFVGSPLLGLVS